MPSTTGRLGIDLGPSRDDRSGSGNSGASLSHGSSFSSGSGMSIVRLRAMLHLRVRGVLRSRWPGRNLRPTSYETASTATPLCRSTIWHFSTYGLG